MIHKIIQSSPLRFLIKDIFDNLEWELVTRPASFLIKEKSEDDYKLYRIIILPPHGHTADHVNEMNPHPEARRAKITVRGGVREEKTGFSVLKQVLKYCYLDGRKVGTVVGNHPYVKITQSMEKYHEVVKSTKETFFVVRENGVGFYHNLINISNEWLILLLEKELRLSKTMDIESRLEGLEEDDQQSLRKLIHAIKAVGDGIFTEHPELVNTISELSPNIAMPALIEALNIHDSGRHEACSVYAMILKIGKKHSQEVCRQLARAVEYNLAPRYYAEELLQKLNTTI
jgi:hypothetical protein